MQCKRLLKGIANELKLLIILMKKYFDEWSDFLRDAAANMDETGKGKEFADCVAITAPHFWSNLFPAPVCSRGAHSGHERGCGKFYPKQRGGHRGGPVAPAVGHRGGQERGVPVPRWQQGNPSPIYERGRECVMS